MAAVTHCNKVALVGRRFKSQGLCFCIKGAGPMRRVFVMGQRVKRIARGPGSTGRNAVGLKLLLIVSSKHNTFDHFWEYLRWNVYLLL